ncbi:MAG TPA: hypothetical protein VHX12_01505, partial [Acidisoma sp.]|nr:hypothetical protein [Acidisoma sp.]
MAGDFFCAPFGKADIEPAPAHGWAANGLWSVEARRQDELTATASFLLDHSILGADLRKHVTLRAGHPVVYQRHVFHGGNGAVPIAHHAMIHAPGGAKLSFSAKDFGGTPATPQESDPARGRSILAGTQRFADLSAVPLADGGIADLNRYPFAERHEDFLSLFDPPNARIGWSAALAMRDGFLFFAVKDARRLNQTSLWMSNGGRFYPPWLSRHRAVLGIEESCAYFSEGHRASTQSNELSQAGYRTALSLDPDGEVAVRYALGAIPVDPTWSCVSDIALADGVLVITDESGGQAQIPFDTDFF